MPAQSMREQLEEAFDGDTEETEEGTEEAGGSTEDTTEPLGDATEESSGGKDEEEGAGDSSSESGEDTGTEDGGGKTPEVKSGDAKEQDTAESETDVRAPVSWKPDAREDWSKIPVVAQKEIARREKHMDHMIRESAESRKHQSDFNELVRPFEGMIAAQQSTPFQAVHNLMQTAAGLTMGSPQQKAQIVQNIMNQYGIDIAVLDQVLAGGMAKQQGEIGQSQVDPNISYQIQQQMAPINQFMGQMNQQRQNYESNQAHTIEGNITAFADDPASEFFSDVQMSMADLMEMSANRNEEMTMQQAYEKACRMDDSINTIISGRAAASNAAANKKTIDEKRHAASSISGGNAANSGEPAAETLRGALTNAWDEAS